MKRRLILVTTALVFLTTLGMSLFSMPGQARAADTNSGTGANTGTSGYAYNDKQFDAIQGPNPFAVADQPDNATYGKAGKLGNGIYVAINEPITNNSGGGTCYPAIQTDNKKYDGDKNGKLYLECGYPDRSDPQGNKRSVAIATVDQNPFQQQQAQDECKGKTGQEQDACTAGFVGGTNGKTEAQACKGFSGANLAACQSAWNDAQSAAGGGDNSPTCENKGGPLAWILCPIFNEVSDASQWIFQNIVQPFLITPPISTDPRDPSFQIWSNLRIYGNIFLLIALLVIVFGESIGGGVIDAYTAKKVLPRLLVAAVLINLSIYIVAFLVDFSNILGQGVGALLTAPLTHCSGGGGGNCWDFQLTGSDQARVFSVGLIGFLASSTAIAGFIGALIFGSLGTVITAAFFVALPMFFAILAVFITLIIRKGLILMLVLISPVAFALYCLPNTERFFKRWWDLLIEALMVYPIIVAIFGVAEILSVTILTANGISSGDLSGGAGSNPISGNLNRSLALVVAFLLQFLPLLAVPFAFRFAGGALSKIYDAATSAGGKINQLAEGRREHAKRDYNAESRSARARAYQRANEFGEQHKGPLGVGRRASRWAGRRAGGYNIEALQSAGRAEYAKQLNDQIATGRDEEIRGLTVNKQQALKGQEGVDWRQRADGVREFKSLGGAWIAEQDVDAGHSRWGSNQYAQQTALSYEMRKAITEEDAGRIATNYQNVATGPGGWGMSDGEAAGAFKGAAFENQNQHVEYKYTGLNGQLNNAHGLVDEIYNNKGSYQLSQMNSHTIESLKEAHTQAVASGDVDQQQKIKAISETFMHDSRVSSGLRPGEGDEGPQPVGEVVPGAEGGRVFGAQGSAHTAERARELATMTGAYQAGPTGEYSDPGHAPTPNRREQS